MKKRRLTWHYQGLYRKDQGKNSSAKYKNQDQPVKDKNHDQPVNDKGFTSVLQGRTRTKITAFISIILYELQPQPSTLSHYLAVTCTCSHSNYTIQ